MQPSRVMLMPKVRRPIRAILFHKRHRGLALFLRRRSASTYDGLSPATAVRRIGTTVLRTVRRSASGYDGPLYLYDGLPPRTTVHLQLRRSVVSVRRFCARYDGL